MSGDDAIIIHSLLEPWTDPERYPGVREDFSPSELARIDGLAGKTHYTLGDKLFLYRMIGKLLLKAD